MNWSADRRLQARMAATLLALALTVVLATLAVWAVCGLIILAVVGVTGLSPGPALTWWAFVGGGGVGALALLAYVAHRERGAPDYAVATTGARRVAESDAPDLLAAVRSVARQADAPVPDVHLAPTAAPLSLVTGYGERDARLVVSSGLLDALDGRELRAVLAHELAHVKNRDAAVMTATGLPTAAAARVFDLLGGPTAGVEYGRVSRASYADAILTVGLLLAAPVWALSRLLGASLSRAREFAADRGAVAITGDPAALASALAAVDDGLDDAAATDLRTPAVATLAVVAPPSDPPTGPLAPVRAVASRIVRSHPATEERVARLRRLERRREGR